MADFAASYIIFILVLLIVLIQKSAILALLISTDKLMNRKHNPLWDCSETAVLHEFEISLTDLC